MWQAQCPPHLMIPISILTRRCHAAVPPAHEAAHARFATCWRFGRKHTSSLSRLKACAQGDNTRANSHLLLAARGLVVDEERGLAKLFTSEEPMVPNLDTELRVSRTLDPLWPALVMHYTVDGLVMIGLNQLLRAL